MKNFKTKALLRVAALVAAGTALSGCVYDIGLGYASDGYYDDYGCDPYGGYDSYYDCDYRSGFYNIGYGGGWYDSFWYPGYGYYVFDNGGRRHAMRDHHRRYWGEKRHNWYRENRGRGDDGNGYRGRGRGRGYSDSATPGTIGWPERHGGRIRDGEGNRRGRGEGRRDRNDQWRGSNGAGTNAVPVPNPEIVQRPGRRRDAVAGDGRRRGGDGQGRPNWRGNEGASAVPLTPQPDPSGARQSGRGDRLRSEGGGYRQAAPQPTSGQADAPAYRPARQPRRESPRHDGSRQRVNDGSAVKPD
jgi:hypothetical protein